MNRPIAELEQAENMYAWHHKNGIDKKVDRNNEVLIVVEEIEIERDM